MLAIKTYNLPRVALASDSKPAFYSIREVLFDLSKLAAKTGPEFM